MDRVAYGIGDTSSHRLHTADRPDTGHASAVQLSCLLEAHWSSGVRNAISSGPDGNILSFLNRGKAI